MVSIKFYCLEIYAEKRNKKNVERRARHIKTTMKFKMFRRLCSIATDWKTDDLAATRQPAGGCDPQARFNA